MREEQEQREQALRRSPSSGGSDPRELLAYQFRSNTGQSNFFGLPRKIRNRIYRAVLYVPHPLYLFQDTGSRVEMFAPERPHRWLALLQVNRQFHVEAAEILYSINHFTLLDERQPQDRLLKAFLACIGPVNSASLSHLDMDFPALDGPAEELKLKDDSLQRLKLLPRHCTTLTTVEMSFSIKHIRDLGRATGENPHFIKEALSQINSQLQAIPSLKNICIRITGPDPSLPTKDCMRALGWAVMPAYGNP